MLGQLFESNGLYLMVLVLCVVGGYHLMKTKRKMKMKEKSESLQKKKKVSGVEIYEIDEDEEMD